MSRVLSLDEDISHANMLAKAFQGRNHSVTVCRQKDALVELGKNIPAFEIVIVDIPTIDRAIEMSWVACGYER